MRNKVFASFASVALLCAVAAVRANGPITPVDYGIETSSTTVLMPSSTTGSVVLTCDSCNNMSFQLTGSTRYMIGTSAATFAEFATTLRGTSARNVMVFVKPDKTVTRMTVSAAAR